LIREIIAMAWDNLKRSKNAWIPEYCSSLQSVGEWIGRDEQQEQWHRPTTQPPANMISVQREGNNVDVAVLGRQRTLVPLTQKFKNCRHDLVLDVLGGGGDERLSLLGIKGWEGNLTPDFISVEQKSVLELATTAVSEEYSVNHEWDRKTIKYKHLLKPLNCQLLILVVSPMLVKSNFLLSQREVNMLCFRVRLGLILESLINEKMGQNMFAEDLTEKENMVEYILSRMPLHAEANPLFNTQEILETVAPVTTQDKETFKQALKETLKESTRCSPEDSEDLREYLAKFSPEKCQHGRKRVSNIPFVYSKTNCSHELTLDPDTTMDMPDHLVKIWRQAKEVNTQILKYKDVLEEASGEAVWERHRIQKQSAFNVDLAEEDRIECAKSGVFGKEYADNDEVIEHHKDSQKSFHPDASTDDIHRFCKWDSLKSCKTNIPMNIQVLIKSAKDLWRKESLGLSMFVNLIRTPITCFSQTISLLMTEIAYCYRYWPKRADFYHKEVNGIHILVRSTGSHIFVSYAFPECCSEMVDPGRLGPNLYYSDNYIFTDFCSYDEPTLEHFVKAGPYLVAIASHLMAHYELSPEKDSLRSRKFRRTLNLIFLLYLNNKVDSEELVTSQRYLVMGILEELDPNPYRFVDRLPAVLRSRLTCYILKKTIKLMSHYSASKVKKLVDNRYGKPEIKHIGLVSIFMDEEISLKQQVNEFYFGYVISKERGRGADRNFKIIKKIIKEEYDARETVKATLDRSIKKKKFVSNPIVIKVIMSLFKGHMTDLYGDQWMSVLKRQILRQLATGTFSDIATLKVASRSYKEQIIIPGILPGKSAAEIKEQLKKVNPEEVEKRPKVMEALSELVAHFILETKHSPTHIVEMLPFCYNLLLKKGYFDTDLFIKPQHGGDREIHVLEIAARVCQFHLEGISRALSRQIPEDSLTHPKSKDFFVSQHHKKTEEKLGPSYFTLGKSADATKWCQRNHVSKFACFMMPILDRLFWNFVLSMLHLWLYKRMSFPLQFASNLMANPKVESDPLYMKFRDEFLAGTGLFTEPKNNKMYIKFGMMQGILHFTSTLTHVILMIVMAKVVLSYLHFKGVSSSVSVISGSDDSAQLLSIQGKATLKNLRLATTMLLWKERMAEYASIYSNRAKSCIGALDLVEYNSEWTVREHILKPTFRWVSACLETTVVERFIDRIRTMYNTLSQVLEGGGKTLECSIIQMCQAWLHYMMLGLHNNPLADDIARMIWNTKDPSLGYFPLDSDFACGIVGVDFQLYHLVVRTGFSKVGYRVADPELLAEDEVKDPTIPDDLRSTKLAFGSLKFWHSLLRRMKVPQLESIIEAVENNPLIIFENSPTWEHCKYQIFLKVFQPGVKESLSSYSPTIRMMSATGYLISKQCFSKFSRITNETSKRSLYQLLETEEALCKTRTITSDDLLKTFPYSHEYDEVLSYLSHLESKHSLRQSPLRMTSKQSLLVFEKRVDEIPLLDMCRRRWNFSHQVPLSSKQFEESWEELKIKYSFIRDSLFQTCEALDMNVVQLKPYLESFTIKSRKIVLMDSAAKSSNIKSAISRVFWPDIKIEMPQQDVDTDSFALRSDIFSVLSFWGSQQWKKDYIDFLLHEHGLHGKQIVPQRIKKLHILSRWRSGQPKHSIINDLKSSGQGLLGFFLKTQPGYGKNRSGDGLWAGTCLGVNINIAMSVDETNADRENVCTEIVIDRLQEPKLLGKLIKGLIDDFKLVKPRSFQKSQLWLSNNGKILPGEGDSSDIPIRVNPDLRVEFIDKLSDADWNWEVTDSKIRLIAAISEDIKITMMSDNFSSRDWDPVCSSKLEGAVKAWSESSAVSLNEFHEEIVSAAGVTNSAVLKASKDPSLMTKSGWSMSALIRKLKEFYIPSDQTPDISDASEISEDIQDLLDFINLEHENTISEDNMYDTESEDEDNDGGVSIINDLFNINNIDESDLALQEDIFDSLPMSRFGIVGKEWGMPKFNSFFSGLDTLSRVMYKKSFQELLLSKMVHPIPGLLGVVLTLVSRKPWCPTGIGNEMEDVMLFEQSVTSITQSLKTDADYQHLNEVELQRAINEIEEAMKTAGELTRPLYRQQILRLSRALVYRSRKTEPNGLTDVSMKVFLELAFSRVQNRMTRPDVILKMEENLRTAFLRSILQVDLGEKEKLAEISPHELALLVESINQPTITTLAMDAVWRGWGVGSETKSYRVGDCAIKL